MINKNSHHSTTINPDPVLKTVNSALTGFLRMSRFLHFLLPVIVIFFKAYSSSESFLGIQQFKVDSTLIGQWDSLDSQLYQRLNFELLPQGIKPLLLRNSQPKSCVAIASGTISIIDSMPQLEFFITNSNRKEEDVKKLIIADYTVDEIIDLLSLKVHHFLERKVSGKLLLSSTPSDCDVLLNGVKIGQTPAEFILEAGKYSIQLEREYLNTFRDSVIINAGKEVSLTPVMKFDGLKTRPWLISALIFTGCTLASQLLEYKLYKDYEGLTYNNTEDQFDRYFNRYWMANIIKVSFLLPTAATWSLTGYSYFENQTLKKKIFMNK